MEEMKQIFLDGEPSPFYITKTGMLFREDTQNWYKPFYNCGYLSYHMKWKGKTYPRRIHRLVAEAYIPNPENKPFIHHKDHDPLNNSIDNLEWVTIKENNLDKLPAQIREQIDEPEIILEKEEWKQYKDTVFYVSNMGRVKNTETKNILKGNICNNGYHRVGLRIKGKLVTLYTHNLVWDVWRGPKKNIINHINGIKTDNRLENLEDITQSENLLKACYETKTRKTMSIGKYDDNGNLIKIYPSQKAAEREMNMSGGTVSRAIRTGRKNFGFYWKKITEEDY